MKIIIKINYKNYYFKNIKNLKNYYKNKFQFVNIQYFPPQSKITLISIEKNPLKAKPERNINRHQSRSLKRNTPSHRWEIGSKNLNQKIIDWYSWTFRLKIIADSSTHSLSLCKQVSIIRHRISSVMIRIILSRLFRIR